MVCTTTQKTHTRRLRISHWLSSVARSSTWPEASSLLFFSLLFSSLLFSSLLFSSLLFSSLLFSSLLFPSLPFPSLPFLSLPFLFLPFPFLVLFKKDGPGTDFSLTTLQRVRKGMFTPFLFYHSLWLSAFEYVMRSCHPREKVCG